MFVKSFLQDLMSTYGLEVNVAAKPKEFGEISHNIEARQRRAHAKCEADYIGKKIALYKEADKAKSKAHE